MWTARASAHSSKCIERRLAAEGKKCRGSSAEGPRHPGFIPPASAVSEQGTRRETLAPQGSECFPSQKLLFVFVAAKEFVALDGRNHADGAFITRFGALHAAKAADPYRSSHGNFVGKRQKNLDGRAFLDILGKKKVDAARADVPGLSAGLANGGTGCPANGQGQPHGKTLSGAAFGTRQGSPPDRR